MRIFYILISVFFIVACNSTNEVKQATSTNYSSKGNLQVLQSINCISLDKLTNMHTPADIFPGIRKCIETNQFDIAADLYAVAGVYGRYDQSRVADRSAHQAITVIKMNNFQSLNKELLDKLTTTLRQKFKEGSSELSNMCNSIKNLGYPAYKPIYMLQHGMSAFTGKGGGIVNDFNPSTAWGKSLDSYLHCPV